MSKFCTCHAVIVDEFEDVGLYLLLVVGVVHDGGLDIIGLQIVVPLLLLVELLNGGTSGPVIPEEVAESLLVLVLEDDVLLIRIDDVLLNLATVLNFLEFLVIKDPDFLELVDELPLVFVDKTG